MILLNFEIERTILKLVEYLHFVKPTDVCNIKYVDQKLWFFSFFILSHYVLHTVTFNRKSYFSSFTGYGRLQRSPDKDFLLRVLFHSICFWLFLFFLTKKQYIETISLGLVANLKHFWIWLRWLQSWLYKW